ncbi:MAG TPA: glycosyltransferase family 87 protein [Chloroflexota bacterium]|nr:glycosyltransferase family 87 protein [Chloroflexota bacterium]
MAVAVATAWTILMAGLISTWLTPWPDSIFLTDFVAFRTAASIVREGDGRVLYDMEAQRQYQRSLRAAEAVTDGVRNANGLIPFHNPPVMALLVAPLALIPVSWGYVLWLLATVMAFALTVALSLGGSRHRLLGAVALLAFPGVADTLLWGQMVGLLALSLCLGMLALRMDRPFLGGVLLGLLWLKPQYAVAFPLLFLMKGRWRELSGMGLSGLGMATLSLVVVGPSGVVSYVDLMRRIGAFTPPQGSAVSPEMMVNWRAALQVLWPGIPDDIGSTLVLLLGVVTLLSTLAAWRGRWDPTSPRFPAQVMVLMAGTLLASPHSHFHGLALLIPPVAMMLRGTSNGWAPTRSVTCALIVGYTLASTLWWLSLLAAPGRTLFWLLAPCLLLTIALGVRQLWATGDTVAVPSR